jgi:hypothetical protein
MFEVSVKGTSQLDKVARQLKEAGDKGMRRELTRAVQEAGQPLKVAERRSAALSLPHRGGLAGIVAKGSVNLQTRLGANPSVRLRYTSKHDIKSMNAGRLRHPLWGNRSHWFTQAIKPGWFDRPIEANAPQARKAVLAALDRISKQLS